MRTRAWVSVWAVCLLMVCIGGRALAQTSVLSGTASATGAATSQQSFVNGTTPTVNVHVIDTMGNKSAGTGNLTTNGGSMILTSHACSGGGPGFGGQANGDAHGGVTLDYAIVSSTLPIGTSVPVTVQWSVNSRVTAVGQDMVGANTSAYAAASGTAQVLINGSIVENRSGVYSYRHNTDGINHGPSGNLDPSSATNLQVYDVLVGQQVRVSLSFYADSASSVEAGQTDGDVQMNIRWGVTSASANASAVYADDHTIPAPPAAAATPEQAVLFTPARPTYPGILPCFRMTTQPVPVVVCSAPGSATFSVVPLGTGPFTYQWQVQTSTEFWSPLGAIPVTLPCGASVQATTPTASQTGVSIVPCAGASTYTIRCIITNPCGSIASTPVTMTINTADFNGDGNLGTDSDIEGFFACLSGSCCPACGSADFNGDGNLGTDSDIESFFRVLGGGPC